VDFALFMVAVLKNDELVRGPGDCRLQNALFARARCRRMNFKGGIRLACRAASEPLGCR
jgi:hypothetical protein